MVIPSVPIRLFNNDILRVIIDLKSKTTLCSYFYKKVAYSSKIKSDTFVYNPKNGGCKNKLSLDKLKSKIIEQNERRQGILYDLGLHYFGNSNLKFSEVLCSYLPKDIQGIVVPRGECKFAKEALLFRARFSDPLPRFYRYKPSLQGLTIATEEEILTQAGIVIHSEISEILTPRHIKNKINDFLKSNFFSVSGYQDTLAYDPSCLERPPLEATSCQLVIDRSSLPDNLKSIIDQQIKKYILEHQATCWNSNAVLSEIKNHIDDNQMQTITIQVSNEDIEQQEVDRIHIDEFLTELLQSLLKSLRRGEADDISLDYTPDSTLDYPSLGKARISIEEIKEITCPTRHLGNGKISRENPLQFKFTDPQDKNITCIAKLKDGYFILDLYRNDEEKPYSRLAFDKMSELALKYYRNKAHYLNTFILQDDIQKFLNDIGIISLRFSILSKKCKHYIVVSFQLNSKKEKSAVMDILVNIFKIPRNKIEEKESNGEITIDFPLVPDLDLFFSFIKNYQQSSLQKPSLEQRDSLPSEQAEVSISQNPQALLVTSSSLLPKPLKFCSAQSTLNI